MGPEARVACPACGGPIHPVAGRCKHCKTDLAARRAGKPQGRSGALPSLGNRTTNERAVSGPPSPGRRTAGRAVLPLVAPATASFGMGSPLPSSGLPTGHAAEPPTSWAVIVIALSAVAIIVAVGVIAAQL